MERFVLILCGVVLFAYFAGDAVETLISTRTRRSRMWISNGMYRVTWPGYRRMCQILKDPVRRESLLSVYGPSSLLALMVIWVAGLISAWACIWFALRDALEPPITGFLDALYYSGVVFFSVGCGDLLPVTGVMRGLTITEALCGLATMGLVIGYLPSLYGAYQSREHRLVLLDDLTDSRITPISFVRSHVPRKDDLSRLDAEFDAWSTWCAELYGTHSSFPMLVVFRSQHRGQSWVSALGVVTDAAMAAAAGLPESQSQSALRLYRQATRTVQRLGEQIGMTPKTEMAFDSRYWSYGYSAMQQVVSDLRPFDESLARLIELRREFTPWMEAFLDVLDAPRGFWGPTSAETLVQPKLSGDFERLGR